jgi:hypothetical protein
MRSIGILFLWPALLSTISSAQSSGLISTYAGNGTAGFSGDGGLAISAQINSAEGVAADSAGNLYIADTENNRIRKVTPVGIISTVAGGGGQIPGDGGPATSARLYNPTDVEVDSAGNLYIAEFNNHRVRKVTPEGVISTLAEVAFPTSVAIDREGNIYIAVTLEVFETSIIRRVTPAGVLSTVAGGGVQVLIDGGPATSAQLSYYSSVAVDSVGNLYISDHGCVRKVTSDGIISTVAGGGDQDPGDGGPATSAWLAAEGIAVDAQDSVYIADTFHAHIRKVTPDGVISTVAGIGTHGHSGDGGPATLAQLEGPGAVAVDFMGNIFIAEGYRYHRIRKVAGSNLPAVTTYFPQIAVGGGWSTLFTFVNTGLTEASGTLNLRDSQGNPLIVNCELIDSSGTVQPASPASSFSLSIPPAGSVFLSATAADAISAVKTGWGQLDSPGGPVNAVATYEYVVGTSTVSMVSVPQSQPLQAATIPVDMDNSLGKQPANAIVNPGSQTISVKLTLISQDGTVFDDTIAPIDLGPGQQIARYLWEELASRYPKFRGSLAIRGQNGQTFVVFALLDKQGLLTAIPVITVR